MSCSCKKRRFSVCTLIQILVIFALAWLMLAGCNRNPEPTPTQEVSAPLEPTAAPTDTAAPEPTAEPAVEPTATEPTVSTTTSITVAVDAQFKPFLYRDESNTLTGFDIDIMNALSKAGDFEVAYINHPFDGILQDLAAGQYDAAMSAITINDQRREIVDFTEPYFEPGQAQFSFFSSGLGMAVRMDETNIMGKDDLANGLVVGVKRGTTGDDYVAALPDVTIVRFPESSEALDALSGGTVDAVVVDVAVIADYTKNNVGQVKLVGGPLTNEVYGIAVSKDRPDVLAMLNDALAEIRADGVYDQIVARWFSAP